MPRKPTLRIEIQAENIVKEGRGKVTQGVVADLTDTARDAVLKRMVDHDLSADTVTADSKYGYDLSNARSEARRRT